MTPDQARALELRESGMSRPDIAVKMGKSERQVKSLLYAARKWLSHDPSAQMAAKLSCAQVIPHSYWIKANGVSAYFKTGIDQDNGGLSLIDRVAEAFQNIPAYQAQESTFAWSDLLTVYPLMDLHMGMYAWGDETGGDDYDLQHAVNDIKTAFAGLDRLSPVGGEAILMLGGDTLHANDMRAETPKSKHKLDVDGRHYKVLDEAIKAISWIVEHLAARHEKVTVRVLAGNHDPESHLVLTFALAERYRDINRIVIEKSPLDLFMFRWGNSLIAAHHGDKSPPQRLAMMLADVCPFWSDVKYRHIMTGHIHHESAKDFPGIKWESLRAFCPPDAYGAGFAPRRAMTAQVFDSVKGRVLVASDPIGRE